jgi:multisubunit Na+/H+ antiporter MnhF subunit
MASLRATAAVVVSALMLVLSYTYEQYTAAGVFLLLFLLSSLTFVAVRYDGRPR